MLSAILTIALVAIIFGTLAYFFNDHLDFVLDAWEWVKSAVTTFQGYVPAWVLPFLVVALVLSAVGIILKLL